MTSSQENTPVTPEIPVQDFGAERRAEVLDTMGLPAAHIRYLLGSDVAAPTDVTTMTTLPRLKTSGRSHGHILPGDREFDSDFAPDSKEVIARQVSTGLNTEMLQERDRVLAWADWQRALRIAKGDPVKARAVSLNSATHIPKGNPRV